MGCREIGRQGPGRVERTLQAVKNVLNFISVMRKPWRISTGKQDDLFYV